MSYLDDKTAPHSYKVNLLNTKGKEIWRYVKSIKSARKIQGKALSQSLDSTIFQYRQGIWRSI